MPALVLVSQCICERQENSSLVNAAMSSEYLSRSRWAMALASAWFLHRPKRYAV